MVVTTDVVLFTDVADTVEVVGALAVVETTPPPHGVGPPGQTVVTGGHVHGQRALRLMLRTGFRGFIRRFLTLAFFNALRRAAWGSGSGSGLANTIALNRDKRVVMHIFLIKQFVFSCLPVPPKRSIVKMSLFSFLTDFKYKLNFNS